MKLLLSYLKNYKWLVLLALLLAAINQVFSLLDPLIFKRVVDEYATSPKKFTKEEYIKGIGFLILLSMGAAMVSRIAKNFQDYFMNVITQKLGAKIYSDGLKHSLELPYQVFEDHFPLHHQVYSNIIYHLHVHLVFLQIILHFYFQNLL